VNTSPIEWTEVTWNPTSGCDRISPGCDHCYALTLAKRLKAMGQPKYQTDGDPRTSGPGFGVTLHPDALLEPLRWRKPRKVFVDSMADVLHAKVPVDFLAQVWAVMALTPQHTYQVLTKRPERYGTSSTTPAAAAAGTGLASTSATWSPTRSAGWPAAPAIRSTCSPAGRWRTCGLAPRSSQTTTSAAPTPSELHPQPPGSSALSHSLARCPA
jgi:hypothetical protein